MTCRECDYQADVRIYTHPKPVAFDKKLSQIYSVSLLKAVSKHLGIAWTPQRDL